tara:strand:+ start:1103 stop:1477 length:375 start_codon:yes stop_codon:yes gene_type:complete
MPPLTAEKKMTKTAFKKEIKEKGLIHTYGNGRDRCLALFWDWANGQDGDGNHYVGFKWFVRSRDGILRKELIDSAYDLIINGNLPFTSSRASFTVNGKWVEYRMALGNNERLKIPMAWSGFSYN